MKLPDRYQVLTHTILALAALFVVAMTIGSAEAASVRETVYRIGSASGTGSAVVIAPGYLVTAAHVIADAGERGLRISTPRGPRHVTVVFVNEHTDIAIITADVDCPCAEIAQRQVETPAKVVAIGYPLGLPIPTFTFGHVQGVDADGMVYMTAPITGGTSGGGMFDDRGMLQGVLLATANDCFGWVQRDDVETVDPTTSVCTRVHWMSFASTLTDLKTAILVAAKRLGSDVLAKTIWDPTPQVNLGVRG